MDPEEIEYFRNLKREERRFAVPSLIKNLEERSLGHLRKNVTSKEFRELFAEELLIEKDNYDELRCEMPGMPRSTFLMVFSPDGTKVASTHGNHNIYVTDIRSGKNLKTLVGHPRTPWCIAFHPTSNQIVASGCLGGQVRIWDLSGGSEVWTATNQTVIASIAFHPLERILVIATSNEVYFWDWSKPEPFLHTSTGSHKEKVRYVAFDKLGHKLITGISNSHSRWEYVRSSERSYDPPLRHFNITSRRPVLRRGLFPSRHNMSVSSSSNVPREAPSRVPERERNITISYRNLVRQYGRLVQRYLQLYRPPAMIDRGTDPMENFVPSSSNETSELQESNSSNNAANVQESENSNNTGELQESNISDNTTNLQEPNVSNNTIDFQEPNISNNTASSQEPNISSNTANAQEPNISSNTADLQGPIISNTTAEHNISNNAADLQEPNTSNNPVVFQETTISDNTADLQEPTNSNNTADSSNISGNTANSQEACRSNDTADMQESKSSNDPAELPEHHRSDNTTDVQPVSNISNDSEELGQSYISNTFNSPSSVIDQASMSLQSINDIDTNSCTSSVQPSESGSAVPSLSKKHKNDAAPQNKIPTKKFRKSRTDNGDHYASGSESTQQDTSASSNRPSAELSCRELIMNVLRSAASASLQGADRTDGNDIDTNQGSPTQSAVLETENHESDILSTEHVENTSEDSVQNNQETNISSRVQTDNLTENTENIQEPTTPENQRELPWFCSVPLGSSAPRDVTERSYDQRQERNARDSVGDYTRIYRRPVYDLGTGQRYTDIDYELLRLNTLGPSSLVDGYMPGTSGVSENREPGEEQVLESMMMNMRRNAEDNLRARFMPVIRSRVPENDREELISLPELPHGSPPNPVGNTSTGTTNSTSYSLARRLGNIGSFSSTRISCPRTTQDFRRIRTFSSGRWRMSPGQSQRAQVFGIRPLSSPTVINNFPRDEVINFSEFPNSEDDPFLSPERTEPLPSSSSESFHPFNPPPNLPAINPENIGIGNMYSNIVQDLETSLNNARDTRILDRPGEMSNMLSNFSNRLETLMNQSEGILRNLRTSVDVLPDNDPMEYAEEAPVPTASFNDSTFFVRDQRTEGTSPARNFNDPLGYDMRQNNAATSDHTYPRNSETASTSSNMNETMSPLMSSLHLTLSHIQIQSRLLHRQVECIERIDRAMVEVAQLQLMRLLLVELSTYVRNLSGESRSTSMSSVRQMMAGTRISDSSPGDVQNTRHDDDSPIYDPGPSTSSGSRGTQQSSSARSRGLTRKTYPPSRLNRPRDLGYSRSTRNSQDQSSSANPAPLPSVAPLHTYSQINLFTLIRMDRRLQSLIDDHSTRFSYLNEHFPTSNTRRQFNEIGEHNLALRLRESINRTNRLLGNIFNANVVRNYRIDSSTSLRHGIERSYERTLLSLIIDGISSHLDENRTTRIPSDIRTRMQNVLQLAMMMSDLLLLYTINSLAPTTDVNLDTERNILANRISETCTTMIQCRQYRNFSNIFVTSLRSLRLMVSTYCSNNYARFLNRRREYLRSQLTTPHVTGSVDELNELVDRGQIPSRITSDNAGTVRESNDNTGREPSNSTGTETNETRGRQPSNRRGRQPAVTRGRESINNRSGVPSDSASNNSPLINACLYLARRQRAQHQSSSRPNYREVMAQHLRNILRENRSRVPTTNTDFQNLSETQQEPSSSAHLEANSLANEDNGRTRRRNSTDLLINAYLTAGRSRTQNQLESNETSETNLQPNSDRNSSSTEPRTNRSLYRGTDQSTSFEGFRPTQNSNEGSSRINDPLDRSSTNRGTGRINVFRSLHSWRNEYINNARNHNSEPEENRLTEREQNSEPQVIRPTQTSSEGSSRTRDPLDRSSTNRPAGRTRMYNNIYTWRNDQINNIRNQNSATEENRQTERDQSAETQANLDINQWWENAVEHLTSENPEYNHRHLLFSNSNHESPLLPQLAPLISPIRTRSPRTNNTSEASEPQRSWRIPSVQVNDVPIELAPAQESSESDNSPSPASHNNNNNSTYPRVMARLAAIRSVSVYNPIGVLRPRLLHPLYATLNPFDADLEQREHIYDSDVISTVTPNHRIQIWDISDSNIPDISDPLKNLVVRECKIHNDASVDIASDGSILVTLLPSGGYLNITNRLGIYSLRWETLGQCLYTTSFVHNAVSVSLSPLGRHLVVGLASRRVSLLPNDRWMMASIFKIEEKDTPGDHLPFIRQIDRGSDERATSHKSVNCIRWLPTSGQGLIYATNTGQLNIWT